MKHPVREQNGEIDKLQTIQNSNSFFIEVDAELLGDPNDKKPRRVSSEEYKAIVERLYFR